MFKKILIVEDIDIIGFGIAQMLKQRNSGTKVIQSLYCDDAYLKFLRAEKDKAPFNLVITDLSFKKDYRNSTITSGISLVKKLKDKNADVKTIVYSVEDRSSKIKKLYNGQLIDAYVLKGRNGLRNLTAAIEAVWANNTYLCPESRAYINKRDVFEINDYDIRLLTHLSYGQTQENIATYFKEKGISPSGVSSIEKRLNRLKLQLDAKNTIQLVANAKDLGLI